MITLTLPMPVSTNQLYRIVGKRLVLSAKYRAWIYEAGWELKRQKPGSIKGRVKISYVYGKSNIDLDNRKKSLLDLLKQHGVIEDDSPKFVCEEGPAVIDESVAGVRVTIEPFYDREKDIRGSVNLCLATVKERMAKGGPAWPPQESPHPQPTEGERAERAQPRSDLEKAGAAHGGVE
jgi:Holliday junction resolvase RusA-like endonuclease